MTTQEKFDKLREYMNIRISILPHIRFRSFDQYLLDCKILSVVYIELECIENIAKFLEERNLPWFYIDCENNTLCCQMEPKEIENLTFKTTIKR